MQSSPIKLSTHSEKRSHMLKSKTKLNKILLSQHKPSPFGKSSAPQIDDRPILILIDADSVSEELIIQYLDQITATALQLSAWVCANRELRQVQAWVDQMELNGYIHTHQVTLGQNEADHFLIAKSQQALKNDQCCAAIIYTLDRDLFKIVDTWRLAGKAVFLTPLRLKDESAQNLIKRCQEQGIQLLSPQLDLIPLA